MWKSFKISTASISRSGICFFIGPKIDCTLKVWSGNQVIKFMIFSNKLVSTEPTTEPFNCIFKISRDKGKPSFFVCFQFFEKSIFFSKVETPYQNSSLPNGKSIFIWIRLISLYSTSLPLHFDFILHQRRCLVKVCGKKMFSLTENEIDFKHSKWNWFE